MVSGLDTQNGSLILQPQNPTEGNSRSNTNMFLILQVISTITTNEEELYAVYADLVLSNHKYYIINWVCW